MWLFKSVVSPHLRHAPSPPPVLLSCYRSRPRRGEEGRCAAHAVTVEGARQALCCCVWLVPLRLYPDLVNTACLARAARNLGANLLLSVFLTRELVTQNA